MANHYNLSPTEKLNYVQKGKVKGQSKKIIKQFLFSSVIIALFLLVFIPLIRNKRKSGNIEMEIARVRTEVDRYEKSNQELEELLSYLSSKQAVEEKARLSWGLQKAGETVLVIKKEELADKAAAVPLETEQKSNFKKWLDYFFNN